MCSTRLSVHVKYQDILRAALEKGFLSSGHKINLFALEDLLAVLNFFFFAKLFQDRPASAIYDIVVNSTGIKYIFVVQVFHFKSNFHLISS